MKRKVTRKNSQARLEEMLETLRGEMEAGAIKAGAYLPSESDLEKRFKMGNSSVRKGLEQLVQEGLIRKIPRVGNQVIRGPNAEEAVVRLGVYNTTERETDLSALLERFKSVHPNVRIQTVLIPTNEYTDCLRQYIADGTLDAAVMNHNTFNQLTDEEKEALLEPVEPYKEHYPFTVEPFVSNGRLLAQPLIFSPLIICYNEAHRRERNMPRPAAGWTWDELIALAQELAVDNERFGFCFHLLSPNRWPIFLLQSGIDFKPDEHGRYHLPESKLVESLSISRRLIERPNVFPAMLSGKDAMAVEWFKDGKVSMIMTTYYSLNLLKDSGLPYDVAPPPASRENRNLLSVIGLGVSRKSQRKEEALQLARFLGSYEAQLTIRKRTTSIPALRTAAEWIGETEAVQPPSFSVFRQMIPGFRQMNHVSLDREKLKVLQKQFELFLTGLQDGSAMCRQMEDALNGIHAVHDRAMGIIKR